jgi:hypothetical protein
LLLKAIAATHTQMRALRTSVVAAVTVMLVGASPAVALRGAHRPVPIVLERSQFPGGCDRGSTSGTTCNFWYANGSAAIGDANWSFVNLDSWGINRRGQCPSAPGSAALGDEILDRYPLKLGLDKRPTYACSVHGHASSNFQDLADIVGQHRLFPVNDCSQQVDAEGHLLPCGTGTPDKFAIVSYRRFIVAGVIKGNDPAAIGTPGTPSGSGTCTENELGLDGSGARDLDDVAIASCLAVGPIDSIPFDAADSVDHDAPLRTSFKVYEVTATAGGPVVTYYQGCLAGGATDGCDYTYDPATFALQWVDATSLADGATKLVDLMWIVNGVPGTPGACGIRPSDPNALCLVLQVP